MQVSTEVAFQKGSALATGLTTIFAEVFQFKNNLPAGSDIGKTVLEHVAKVTVPAMSEVITQMTGITVRQVELCDRFSCFFGASMYLGDNPADAIRVLNQITGNYVVAGGFVQLMTKHEMEPTTYNDLVKIMNSFDSKLSYYRNTQMIPSNLAVSMTLIFDPYAAFLLPESLNNKVTPFEPQEITAIVLHEIGHMVSVLEMAAEIYYMNDVIKRSVEYFGEHAPSSEVAKYITDTLLVHEDKLPDGFMDKLSAGLKNRSLIFTSIVRGIMNLFSLFGVLLFPVAIIARCFGGIVDKVQYSKLNMSSMKTSDLYGYANQVKQVENFADNFVVRHGLGSYLLSGFKKLEEILLHKPAAFKKGVSRSFEWELSKYPTYVAGLLFGNTASRFDEHGTYTQRAQNILDETLKVFKNFNLPPDVLSYYLNDYNTCKLLLQRKPGITVFRDAMEKFYKFVEYVMATPIALFGNARFDQEYEKLIQHVNSLKNNRLYYFSAVFQNYLNNH